MPRLLMRKAEKKEGGKLGRGEGEIKPDTLSFWGAMTRHAEGIRWSESIRKREMRNLEAGIPQGIRVGDYNAIIAAIDPKGLSAQFLFNSQP